MSSAPESPQRPRCTILPSGPSVTIVIPALNEENYIRRAIASLTPTEGGVDYELIVLDGGSIDRTREIVSEMSAANRRIRLASNAARFQAAAMNIGAKIAKPESDIIIRADGHSEYPPGFVGRLVQELCERKVASVVVSYRSTGITFVQRAIAAAQNSRLGNGGAAHRIAGASRYVEHGHHAAFDRKTLLTLGGYDESFTHNEDAELDVRLSNSGAKIWLCSDLDVAYFPRKTFGALARQYFNYGAGRAKTILKHRCTPKPRQLLPVGILSINSCSLVLGTSFGWPFFLPALAYFGTCAVWGGVIARYERDPACLASGLAATIMHHSWAAGFLAGSLRSIVRKSAGDRAKVAAARS